MARNAKMARLVVRQSWAVGTPRCPDISEIFSDQKIRHILGAALRRMGKPSAIGLIKYGGYQAPLAAIYDQL